MITLDSDIEKLSGAGVAMSKKLDKLGIKTVRDLLFYFPFRYDDFSQTTPISKAVAGSRVNIVGQIELIQNKRRPRKRMNITEALINDGSETIRAVWFNQPFIARGLRTGDNVSLSGKVENDYTGLMMQSPSYEKIYLTPAPASSAGQDLSLSRRGSAIHTQGLVPNYHLTQGITQKQIRFFIKQIIGLANATEDWLPEEIKTRLKLLDLGKALAKIHFPKNNNDIKEARERIAFDELFLIQLQSQLIRRDAKSCVSAESPFREKEIKKFVGGLPFQLTNAQRKAAWEILQDISKNKPMSRLLEGDVGSGKTVVAVMAMLNIALNKKQAVLMVPTEILAQQHYESICRMLAGFDVKVGLLTRSVQRLNTKTRKHENTKTHINKKKKMMIEIIKNGEVDIVIGTHALIQENIEFKNLALAVIDEQHRFGVEQRRALISKSAGKNIIPHFLSMTATPIPRSLALALYGDLDLSIIDEMPKGRKKIQTFVVPENKRQDGYKFIRKQIESGRQVFVICPLIDFSDKLGVRSVKEEFKKLNENIFPDLQIGFLHGRMPAKEKEKIMQEFLDNKIKILVSTSVVEVGIDVPNATVMMIEGADRFGLAQLHQFRGRVGRSDHQSYCFLFSDSEADRSIERLQALTNCYDGFELAKTDLKFRGPGEVYGTAQKGFPEMKVASLFDYQLMQQARDEAIKLINKDANLKDWPELKNKLDKLENNAHLE
ncbi:ATP-dependent DNA helicase RecG [Candidatus Parcubacteria bacterium]|nr:ATP-dependent DNA helicase RecG [Candidatus Parcubacteria bacterium]